MIYLQTKKNTETVFTTLQTVIHLEAKCDKMRNMISKRRNKRSRVSKVSKRLLIADMRKFLSYCDRSTLEWGSMYCTI